MHTLTAKERKEDGNFTIGRLRGAIKQGTTERALALLEKISGEYMELRIIQDRYNAMIKSQIPTVEVVETRSFHTLARDGEMNPMDNPANQYPYYE